MNQSEKRQFIWILGAIAALGPFSIDMYLPAFGAIAKSLGSTNAQVALSLSSYFIGISVGQLIYGPLLDKFGRKPPLIVGLSLYLISAIACVAAPNVETLIALRFIMGMGGCAGMVASRAMVRDSFETKEMARVFSTLILIMGVAPIVAPTMGGLLVQEVSWHYIFWILAIFSLALTFVIFKLIKETSTPNASVSLQPMAVAKNYWNILKNKQFVKYCFMGSFAMAGMFAYIADSSFVFMDLYGYSEFKYGWFFGLNALGFIGGSQLNRYLLKTNKAITLTRFFMIALLLLAICIAVFLQLQWLNDIWLLGTIFFFLTFLGFINPNSTALALEPFKSNAGIASALLGFFRMLIGAASSAAVSIFNNGSQNVMIYTMIGCSMLAALFLFGGNKSVSVKSNL